MKKTKMRDILMKTKIIIKMKKQCKKCYYEWESRINNPKVCPRCKSYNWNKTKEKIEDETN